MIVICKKNTKRLVKGLRYEVQNLWNDGTNQRWIEGKVEIKNIGRFTVSNFTDVDGKTLPKINLLSPVIRPKRLEFGDLKKGDILVCTSDSYKTLAKGAMYKIESVIEKKEEKYNSYTKSNYYTHDRSIRLQGISRPLKFSPWRFRALTPEENRDISLTSVLGGEVKIITSSKIRKIEMFPNKEQELIKSICKSALDENRHHLSVLDWAIQKSSENLGLCKEDFSKLLEMPLKELIKILE